MNKLLTFFLFFLFVNNLVFANPKINARTVILFDFHSEEILHEFDPDAQIYPASMTKIMTSIIAFDLIKKINYPWTIGLQFLKMLETFSKRLFIYVYNGK